MSALLGDHGIVMRNCRFEIRSKVAEVILDRNVGGCWFLYDLFLLTGIGIRDIVKSVRQCAVRRCFLEMVKCHGR